jgi:acetoin utilization protein AcuC
MTPLYIGSEIYRNSSYGPKHPLAVPRVSVCTDLCRALGWLPDAVYRDAPMATEAELTRFHDPAYVAALRQAEQDQAVSDDIRARFRIGAEGNPVYREVYRRPAISAGGVMLAARLTGDGGIVHCPGGGTHHGRADRASGFCFLNDPVLGLLTWLDLGLDNIVYLDIDAHHGDGVQDAFHDDPRVLTISLHEANRWPYTGVADDRAGGAARNFPLPRGCNDSEFAAVFRHAVLPLIDARRPQAIMLQAGAGKAVFVQQRPPWRGADGDASRAASGRAGRRRLQPVDRRAVLGADLGHAERKADAAPAAAGGRGRAARIAL